MIWDAECSDEAGPSHQKTVLTLPPVDCGSLPCFTIKRLPFRQLEIVVRRRDRPQGENQFPRWTRERTKLPPGRISKPAITMTRQAD
jgi:hypothetical protein